jgi:hypothetical protein
LAAENTEYCEPCKTSINNARGQQFENAYDTISLERINALVKGRTGGILPVDAPNAVFDPYMKIYAKRYYLEMQPYPILPPWSAKVLDNVYAPFGAQTYPTTKYFTRSGPN